MKGDNLGTLLLGAAIALAVWEILKPKQAQATSVPKQAYYPPASIPITPQEMINHAIQKYSQMYGVDPYLVAAIIKVESNFNPKAIDSAHTSYGLMQLLPSTARWLGYSGPLEGLFNIDTNINYGTKYLGWLAKRPNIAGDPRKIAMGYNAGPDLRPYDKANRYASKVMYWYNQFKAAGRWW